MSEPVPNSSDHFCVLIVEEKSDLRTFYMNALTKTEQYDVKNAATPTDALEILEKEYEKIQLVVCDWNMPDMPGSVFCQRIKADTRFSHIDILVCSSDFDQEDSFLLVELEIYNVIKKASNVADFTKKVDEVRLHYKSQGPIISKLKTLQNLLNEMQIEECEELFKSPEIEQEILTNPRYVHLGGERFIIKKQYQEAVDFLKNFLTKNFSLSGAENLKSLSTLGKALCLNGKFYDALLIFQRLESKSPRNLSHKIMAGDAHLGMDQIEEAKEKFDEVLEADPQNQEALEGMGKASALQGDFEASKTFFSKIPGNFESRSLASFFNNRGVALVRQGQLEEAIHFYENALQFLDKFKGHVFFNLGLAHYRIGRIEDAVHAFEAALSSKDASQLVGKTILKELQEKGVDAFVAEYQQKIKIPAK